MPFDMASTTDTDPPFAACDRYSRHHLWRRNRERRQPASFETGLGWAAYSSVVLVYCMRPPSTHTAYRLVASHYEATDSHHLAMMDFKILDDGSPWDDPDLRRSHRVGTLVPMVPQTFDSTLAMGSPPRRCLPLQAESV